MSEDATLNSPVLGSSSSPLRTLQEPCVTIWHMDWLNAPVSIGILNITKA